MTHRIAINDATILIDLVKTGLFEASLKLSIVYHTTSIIFEELHDFQRAFFSVAIQQEKYRIIEITLDEMAEIYELVTLDKNLSEQDWSAYYFSKKWMCLLLTGDTRLRNRASSEGIQVCGILWILDELLSGQHITPTDAYHLLQQLMSVNKRLPQNECMERLRFWSKYF